MILADMSFDQALEAANLWTCPDPTAAQRIDNLIDLLLADDGATEDQEILPYRVSPIDS